MERWEYCPHYGEMVKDENGCWVSLADAQAEIARLRGALEKCSTALYLAAPFADGCNVEDALTIEVGRAAARELLK